MITTPPKYGTIEMKQNITADMLDVALDRIADIIVKHPRGHRMLPVYERLESELNLLKAKEDTMASVMLRLSKGRKASPQLS